jgi:hypothetical protein
MTVPERYRLSFPVYRPVNEDDHYLNNRFVERIFNALPITKFWHARRSSNQYGLVVGTEVQDLTLTVPAVIGEQFMVNVSMLAGESANSATSGPGTVGGRVIIALYASYNGTDQLVQRVVDHSNGYKTISPATLVNFGKFATAAYFVSPVNGNIRFYMKCTNLVDGAVSAYVSASTATNSEMTVQSFGVA